MYNYREAMMDDIKEYLEEEDIKVTNAEEIYDKCYDDLFVNDSITGNASGSYYCNAYKAKEALEDNMDLVVEAYREFGYDALPFEDIDNPEKVDVTIRCYLLPECLWNVLDELEAEEGYE